MRKEWHIGCSRCAVQLRSVIAAAIFSMLIASAPLASAQAQITLQRYKELSSKAEDHNAVLLYLAGLLQGVVWVENEYSGLEADAPKIKRFFCLPKAAKMDDIRLAIDEELARRAEYWGAMPGATVGQVAVETLRRLYPCP